MSDQGREQRGDDAGARRPADSVLGPAATAVFDHIPVGAAVLGGSGVVRHANAVLADLLGMRAEQLVGRALADLVEPDERAGLASLIDDLASGRRNAFECLLPASPAALSGLAWPIRAHVAPVFGPDGRVESLVLQVFEFGPAEGPAPTPLPAGLAAVLEEGSDFLLTVAADGSLTYGNRAAREWLGVGLPGGATHLSDVLERSSVEQYRDVVEPLLATDGSWQGELTLRTRQGRAVSVSARIVAHGPANGAGGRGAVSILARDITELKTAERKLRQLATHDYLTGLPNRLLLYDRLELALNRYTRYGTPVALLFCDLDGFKPVNDAFGHQVGDAVLTEVADRIHSVVRDTDTAARLGGDEFGVLVEGIDDLDLLTTVARRLVDVISEPVNVGGTTAQVGASIGLVVASEACSEPDSLVAAADAAMYRAKNDGRGRFHVWSAADAQPGGGRDG